jgi:hypothetical protein
MAIQSTTLRHINDNYHYMIIMIIIFISNTFRRINIMNFDISI